MADERTIISRPEGFEAKEPLPGSWASPSASSTVAEGVVGRTIMPPSADAVLSDKYRQEAIAQRQRDIASGVRVPEDASRLLAHGASLGWADTITAGGNALFDRRPDAYQYAKA
jgi:hypothetical protein